MTTLLQIIRVGEVINRTVHAFLAFAAERDDEGHPLYWGIYVKPVSRFTGLSIGLIDPFRRYLIYPGLIRRLGGVWRDRAARELAVGDTETP